MSSSRQPGSEHDRYAYVTTDDLKKLPVTMFEDCECIDYVRLAISSKVGADVDVSMFEEEVEIVVD